MATYGELRKKLSAINLDGKNQNQKNNHEILVNWTKPFADTAVPEAGTLREINKRIKNIKKNIVKMSEITKEKIQTLSDAMSDKLYYLYWRWQDEKEHEDFEDYISTMKKEFETLIVEKQMKNAVYFSCGKRPFGLTFDFEGFRVTMYVNSTHFCWKSKQL